MKTLIFGLATSLLAALPAFADVHLTMHDGRVSIVAKDATVRQILTEWARVGQTRIVNVERIPGSPVTLELDNVTEAQALDVLLRSLSGYIVAPRAVGAANLSYYDRIIIMPTIADARPAVSASASASSSPPPPVFQQVPQLAQPVEDHQYDERPEPAAAEVAPNVAQVMPIGAAPPEMMRTPAPNTFQQGLEVGRPAVFRGQPQAPVTRPTAPSAPFGGVAVPGMIAPAPAQPGQPGQMQPPGAPGQPVRRPGGA